MNISRERAQHLLTESQARKKDPDGSDFVAEMMERAKFYAAVGAAAFPHRAQQVVSERFRFALCAAGLYDEKSFSEMERAAEAESVETGKRFSDCLYKRVSSLVNKANERSESK